MITIVDRGSREPPRLSPGATGAPEFAVQFSRPGAASGRPESRSNSFRWTGPGRIHILERGLLVTTRRRSPFGFRTADERFVPASEICEVWREGDSVRVDLRGDPQSGAFFQFWTGKPAIAGTIVRLLPTTRTIEYDGATADHVPAQRVATTLRRRRMRRRVVSATLIAGLVAVTSVLIADLVLRRTNTDAGRTETPGMVAIPSPAIVASATTAAPVTTPAEMANALAEMRRFGDRIEGLRAQYRTAFDALQAGKLSHDAFTAEIHYSLIPRWRVLYGELAFNVREDGSVTSRVLEKLMRAAASWDRGLQDYAEGLQTGSYTSVLAAFDRMSDGNEAQREAWRILDTSESIPPSAQLERPVRR